MQVRTNITSAQEELGQTSVTLSCPVHTIDDVDECLCIDIKAERITRRGGDIWQVGLDTPNDDALHLIGESQSVFGHIRKLETGDPRCKTYNRCRMIRVNVRSICVDIKTTDKAFLPCVRSLHPAGLCER